MYKNLKTHVHTQKVNRSLFQLPSMTPNGSLLFFFLRVGQSKHHLTQILVLNLITNVQNTDADTISAD